MWPFKEKEHEINHTLEAIKDFESFRKTGEKFRYMGVEMIVVSHAKWIHPLGPSAILTANYRNELGEIKTINFSRSELPSLRAENESPN